MKINLKALISALLLLVAVNSYGQDTDAVDSTQRQDYALPVATPYYLQHQFLSVIAPSVPEGEGEVFETPLVLNTFSTTGNGFRSPFRDEEIEVTAFEDEGKKIYVWRFPESQYLREALYMMFVPVDGHYKAYTISIGQMVDWEISTSSETSRSTFGRVKKPESARECLELLKSRGAYTGHITPGEFFQEGYIGPAYR